MADCNTSTNFPGKSVIYQFAFGCGDSEHATLTYKSFGTTNAKSDNTTTNTSENTNDTSGAFTSSIATRLDAEFSVGGFATSIDSVLSNQAELYNYYYAEMIAGRQPTVWIKKSSPNIPFIKYAFCLIMSSNLGDNTDDPSTIEFTFKPTDTGVAGKSAVILVPVAP